MEDGWCLSPIRPVQASFYAWSDHRGKGPDTAAQLETFKQGDRENAKPSPQSFTGSY